MENNDRFPQLVMVLRFLEAVLSLLAAAVALAVTAAVLLGMLRWLGTPVYRAAPGGGSYDIGGKYNMVMTNRVSSALEGVLSVKKRYWIGDDELKAPRPDPKCYGETDDPASLEQLLADAQTLLEGQELYFSTETEILYGSKVHYYLDDSIFAVTWLEGLDGGVYTFSEIKIAHPSQFRRFLADGEFGSEKLYITTEMAESVNAVVASSGDFYRFRNAGTVVYEGEVRRVNNKQVDICYVDRKGDLIFQDRRSELTLEQTKQFVADNDIWFSLAFGPILVDDYMVAAPRTQYSLGEADEKYPRAALCQMDELHYLLAAVNTSGNFQRTPTIYRFAVHMQQTGCRKAYALDGGQTAVIAMNNQLISPVMFGFQRRISDIIYFATAIPEVN